MIHTRGLECAVLSSTLLKKKVFSNDAERNSVRNSFILVAEIGRSGNSSPTASTPAASATSYFSPPVLAVSKAETATAPLKKCSGGRDALFGGLPGFSLFVLFLGLLAEESADSSFCVLGSSRCSFNMA